MHKYLVEFIGTFFLVLTIATAAVYGMAPFQEDMNLAPLAIGLVLMGMTYAGFHVSGAHYNPAATLGLFINGHCGAKDVAPYIMSQLLGAFVGGAAASVITGEASAASMSFDHTGTVILAEFLFTFAVVFVLISTSTSPGGSGNSYYGLAIGGTVAAGILTVGEISLGGFNPAVSLMLAMTGKLSWVDSWTHFLPQILGGISAGFAIKGVRLEDK